LLPITGIPCEVPVPKKYKFIFEQLLIIIQK
jgi:hypothetical protein